MSLLYDEYSKDLDSGISSVEFITSWDTIGRIKEDEIAGIAGTEASTLITKIKGEYISFKIDQNIIRGSIILYSVGRFETFVKQLIEDICERYVKKVGEYEKLPAKLKSNLIIYTGLVMQDSRKYGHGINGIESFIKTLNSNIINQKPCEKINTECITITDTNMRPTVLNELFERIGASKVIDKIAAQASVLSYFETDQIQKAASEIGTKLNILMDLRNSIAHPAPSFTWPTKEVIIDYLVFLQLTGRALDDVSNIYVSTLT